VYEGKKNAIDFRQYTKRHLPIFKAFDREKTESINLSVEEKQEKRKNEPRK
jgi:hypothetical protein